MRFKKLMLVFFLALFALAAVWAVNVVKKASENRNVTHTPRYTPSEIKAILGNDPDAKEPNEIFATFQVNTKIPERKLKG